MRILDKKKYIHILGTFRIVYNFYKTQYVHVSTESKVQRKAASSKYQLGNTDLCLSWDFLLNYTFDILMYFTHETFL